MNDVLLAFYIVELVARAFILRMHMVHDPYSILDVVLVGIDVITMLFASGINFNSSILRIARLAKVSRTFKLLKVVPELHLMMKGLVGAIKAIFWGAVLASFITLLWSILAVSVIHPINKEIAEQTDMYVGCARCPHAYESVFQAAITFTQQIIAGDSWGEVTIPIIDRKPWTALFFFGVFSSLALATMNLILAVIVDSALQARQKSTHDLAKEREIDYSKAKVRLEELCEVLDEDKNGLLSLQELQAGFVNNPEFTDILEVLDIQADDMPVVFGIMDHDSSGEVSYEEFVKELYKMQSNDLQSMVIYIRFYVTQIRKQLLEQLDYISQKIVTKIEQEDDLLKKQLDEEQKLLDKMNEEEEEILNNQNAMLQKLTENSNGGSTRANSSKERKLACGQGDMIRLNSSEDIMSKLQSMEQTYTQALNNMANSIQELTTGMKGDRGSRSGYLLQTAHPPRPQPPQSILEAQDPSQSSPWSWTACSTVHKTDGAIATLPYGTPIPPQPR
jgi:hypothetical protein